MFWWKCSITICQKSQFNIYGVLFAFFFARTNQLRLAPGSFRPPDLISSKSSSVSNLAKNGSQWTRKPWHGKGVASWCMNFRKSSYLTYLIRHRNDRKWTISKWNIPLIFKKTWKKTWSCWNIPLILKQKKLEVVTQLIAISWNASRIASLPPARHASETKMDGVVSAIEFPKREVTSHEMWWITFLLFRFILGGYYIRFIGTEKWWNMDTNNHSVSNRIRETR